MTASRLIFAALNFDCADPAALANFWGNALGRPVSPGAVAGDMAVDRPGRHRGDTEDACAWGPLDLVRRPGGQRVRSSDISV
jgi:hypothetical protein